MDKLEFKPGGLYFWNPETLQLCEAIVGSDGIEMSVSPSGQYVGVVLEGSLHLWDVLQGTELFSMVVEAFQVGQTFELIVTDNYVATLNGYGVISIWNLQGALAGKLANKNPISDVASLPNGDIVVAYFVEDVAQGFEVWRLNN